LIFFLNGRFVELFHSFLQLGNFIVKSWRHLVAKVYD
jgi:hypothetical protein